MGDHYGRHEIEASRERENAVRRSRLPPVAPQQAASDDETREACIAAMTELGMLYRRGVSEQRDFPRIRKAVNAYLNVALACR